MKPLRKKNSKALTLMEMVVAMALAVIIMFGLGVAVIDSQRGWRIMYDRVYGGLVTDGYTSRKACDAVCRKSSKTSRTNDNISADGTSITFYYYDSLASTELDKYAYFYQSGNQLLVEYGDFDLASLSETENATMILANTVESVVFSATGASAQMFLQLSNNSRNFTVATSAVRHNE